MKTVYRYFFRGLITFLPVALTVYLLFLFISGAESMAVWLIRPVIGDFYLPAGADVVLSPWIVHPHPGFWDAPMEFRPEHFEHGGTNARHEFAYFPFSMGPRRCTGDFFAQVEALTHFGWMAPRLRMRCVDPEPPELEPAANLGSKHGIPMWIERA